LVVRPGRVGERVRPLGLAGRHRKLSDLFIDRKVPAAERKTYPVISYGGEILWVPGVIRSELLRVGAHTTAVLRLRARRSPIARS
jgi:tRNA(Ile)-lysidine synthase